MSRADWTPAFKRYQRRVLATSALYAVFLIGAEFAFKQHPRGVLAYALAILPALPVLGIFGALGLYLREEGDEFQRLLIVRQIVIGTGLTLAICTVWGFLETFQLAPRLDAWWVAIVWFGMFGVARAVRGRL